MNGPLVRDVNHRASIEELLNHSYLKSAEPIKETKKHLAVDLSSYEQLTPIWQLLITFKTKWKITPNFCGLLRKPEIYYYSGFLNGCLVN